MRFLSIIALAFVLGCSSGQRSQTMVSPEETAKFNQFLDKSFEEFLSYSPQYLSYLGRKKQYDKLNDFTEEFEKKMNELAHAKLNEMKNFDPRTLDDQAKLSYDLYKEELENGIQDFQWKDYHYPVSQMGGIHSDLPVFMMNIHRVDNESDMRAYIARLEEFRRVFREVIEAMKRSEKLGILPPQFVFPYVLDASQKIIKGRPFDKSETDSPLFADVKAKVNKLKIDDAKKTYFVKKAEQVLVNTVKPSYQLLISTLKDQQKRATTDDGAWKFPRGAEFYSTRLKRYTTTDYSDSKIHKMGLENVARIHNEMREVLKVLNFQGTLQEFFKAAREDKKNFYPNTSAGRQAYLKEAKNFYSDVSQKIPEYFRLLPKAKFEIRAVEKFRENSAGVAFYESPSEDGSRPGVYYVNLKNMNNLPKYENEVVLYHEGAPGHHFQIALAQELKSLPQTRRYAHYGAFVEGWGLYTERLAKEMGAYKDPMSEFGRLSLELMRACRLVVDTGIHSKKWTREDAIKYLSENMAGSLDDQKDEIERYIVVPGQATGYMVGMLKIYELRERAKSKLGSRFDIRDFHDTVLGNGAVPLNVLEELVEKYIKTKG